MRWYCPGSGEHGHRRRRAPRRTGRRRRADTRARAGVADWFARSWLLLALLVVTVLVSVVVRHVVYPAMSWNRDESQYLWQIRALDAGQLLTTTGGLPQFFQPWLTGVTDGQFFSQYTLGWPGVMYVADQLFGSPAASIWWGTVAAILGTYVFMRELTRDRMLSLLTAALMLASPMVITQSGVYLGYLFSLGIGLLFGGALLAGLRRRSPWLLVVGGILLGVLFVTRPYDAVLWAVAMGGYAVFTTWREWGRQARAIALVALGVPPVPRLPARAQPNRHRVVHDLPVHRQGAARQVRLRVSPAHAARRRVRLHARPGVPWERGQRVLRPAVPDRELRRAAPGRGRTLAPSQGTHHLALPRDHGGVPGRLLRVLGQSPGERVRVPLRPGVLPPAVRFAVRVHRHRAAGAVASTARGPHRRAVCRCRRHRAVPVRQVGHEPTDQRRAGAVARRDGCSSPVVHS